MTRLATTRLALLVLAVAALALPASAAACSCVVPDLARDVPAADAAVVGKVTKLTPDPSLAEQMSPGVLSFRVTRVITGDLEEGEVLEFPAGNGGDCGLMGGPGTRLGLLLQDTPDGWTSSMCSSVDPDQLLAYEPVTEEPPFPDDGPREPRPALLDTLLAFLRSLCGRA